jgi:membrane fusion protein (multidrug efflux system)
MSQEPSGPNSAPAPAPAALPAPASPPAPRSSPSARSKGLAICGVILVIVCSISFAYWLFIARHRQSTDDAYVNGNIVAISAQNAGTVLAVMVDATGMVKAGQVVVRLDPSDAQLEVEQAEATLVAQVRSARQLFVEVDRDRAQVASATVELQRGRDDLSRRLALSSVPGAITEEEVSHARFSVAQSEAAVSVADATLQGTLAAVEGTTPRTQPGVQLAASHLRQALLDLERTTIVAPVAGIVDKRTVQVGQRIQSGQSLLAVIPIKEMWVDANFKESQLREIMIGQPVELTSDLYGSEVSYSGWVVGMGAGTGAAFAVLPAQNASGNWIKIVQRLPVRIGLNPDELEGHPLRIGLSMAIEVRIGAKPGGLPATATGQSVVYQTSSEATLSPDIEAKVNAIITRNLPPEQAVPAAAEQRSAPAESAPAAHP